MTETRRGSCLCGALTYELRGPLRAVVACHCVQCRKTSGHYVCATQLEAQNASIQGDKLAWYRSSEHAERGFCSVCGSNLFWRRLGNPNLSVFVGSIDGPTGLKLESQLYSGSAGDYYELPNVPDISQATLK